ncbi:hypothetical protein [Vibrio parahaemolyticus]|uniref:hypothetical protein n=1 Tax=Vibrio parahaemolyticus TaxID=670 RepID=UPI0004A4F547|nr:hypothetical protein [Vibrio parahaemolyticus]
MQKMFDHLMECPEKERISVENQKRARKIDDLLARSIKDVYLNNGKYLTSWQKDEIHEKVRLHLNVVIASIALSKTEEHMMTLTNARRILGRHVVGKKVKKLPDEVVYKMRRVIHDIDAEYKLSKVGKNDKIIVRKKVRQISSILSELVSRYGYEFPWPEIDVEGDF